MALSSTVFTFDIDLADGDRAVYEHLALRVARHPSESDEFLVARVLAYCLEYQEGLEFSRGLSDADDPPLAVRDMTGGIRAWIDVGTPSADRLHRASKAAPRVAVYIHKEHTQWFAALAGAGIYRSGSIEFRLIDRSLIAQLVTRLERRMSFALSVSDGDLLVSFTDTSISGAVTRLTVT